MICVRRIHREPAHVEGPLIRPACRASSAANARRRRRIATTRRPSIGSARRRDGRATAIPMPARASPPGSPLPRRRCHVAPPSVDLKMPSSGPPLVKLHGTRRNCQIPAKTTLRIAGIDRDVGHAARRPEIQRALPAFVRRRWCDRRRGRSCRDTDCRRRATQTRQRVCADRPRSARWPTSRAAPRCASARRRRASAKRRRRRRCRCAGWARPFPPTPRCGRSGRSRALRSHRVRSAARRSAT